VEDRSRAAWLIPTPEFQRDRLAERGLSRGPRELYLLLAEVIEREARACGMPIFVVDGGGGIDATVEAVEQHFESALTEGPLAETVAVRRDGDPGEVVRSFLCECGDRLCEVSLDVRVDAAGDAPVLAAGHG